MTTYLKFEVAGTEYDVNTLTINSNIGDSNASSTFNANIDNNAGIYDDVFEVGQAVNIYSDDFANPTTKIFSGVLESITQAGKEQTNAITISGRDGTAYLMDVLVKPEIYTNEEVSDIIKDLMDKYAPNLTYTNVAVTVLIIQRMRFNNSSLFDIFRKLADLVGYYFYVDTDNDLHFKEKQSVHSGITLDSSNVLSSNIKESSRDVFNNITVYGDRMLTGWDNAYISTGAGSEYVLDYKPHNTIVTVDTVTQRGGIFEMLASNPISGTNYLLSYEDKKIVFTSGTGIGNSIPASGAEIYVKYDRSVPITKFGRNRVSESIYGRRDKVIMDDNIKDPTQAKLFLLQNLEEYASPKKSGKINIKGVYAFTAGSEVTVNLPNVDINNEDFQIISISYNFNATNMKTDKIISINVSKKIADLTDTIKDLILQIKALNARDTSDDVYTRLELDEGDFELNLKEWKVSTRYIGPSFVLASNTNGRLGSDVLVGGSQILLGSQAPGGFEIQVSGP